MKYYRCVKDNFLWKKGAILKEFVHNSGSKGYEPIEDIWDYTESNGSEYISSRIIENNPEWFERVYSDDIKGKLFKTKDEMVKMYEKSFK